jgi:Phage capsid family
MIKRIFALFAFIMLISVPAMASTGVAAPNVAKGVTAMLTVGAVASVKKSDGTDFSADESEMIKAFMDVAEKNVTGLMSEEDALKAIEDATTKMTEEMTELKALIESTKAVVTAQSNIIKQMKINGGAEVIGNPMAKSIAEHKDLLKSIANKTSAEEVVVAKANTVRGSVVNNIYGQWANTIGQLQRVSRSLYNFFNKITMGEGNTNGMYTYTDWDQATSVAAAAVVAEGGVFPESTAKFEVVQIPLRKIGDTLPVSEEFFEDQEMAAAELELFLEANVNSQIDNQIINGDGTGQNLLGLLATVPAYIPVAGSGITNANIYDLCVKTMEAITSVGGAKYRPDFVTLNIADINRLRLKKDVNGNYVFTSNDGRIESLNIIEDNSMPANQLVVGDSRYARIVEKEGVVLSKGEINAQFTSDMSTLKARKRILFLIRKVDRTGFRKVTNITTALTTLGT